MNSSVKHIPYLDGWRGLAILAVLFSHFFRSPGYWWVGRFGVQLFFVLSGYLMFNILFVRKVELSEFFARRAIRILPAFMFFVATMTLLFATLPSQRYLPTFSNLVAILSFTRTYLPAGDDIFKDVLPIGHFWSLNVEEHSYVFLAAVAAMTRHSANRWRAGMALIAATLSALAFSQWYYVSPPTGGSPGDVRTEAASLAVLASVTIAYLRHQFPDRQYKRMPSWLPLMALAGSFLCFSTFEYGLKGTLSPLLLAFAINFFDRVPDLAKVLLANPLLRWFGICSFSLYLWQQPFLWLANQHLSGALMGSCGIIVGSLAYYFFENPVRSRLISMWERRKTPHGDCAHHASPNVVSRLDTVADVFIQPDDKRRAH